MFKASSGGTYRRVKATAGGPRTILSNLLRDGNTVANYQPGVGITGSPATAWSNQIGAAGSLIASGTGRPTVNADGSLTFDGVANFMTAAFTLIQPTTIYLVAKQITWTNGNRLFDGSTLNGGILAQNTATPQIAIFAGSTVANNSNMAVGTRSVVTVIFSGASSSIKVDGTTATTGNAGTNNMNGFTLGAQGGGGGVVWCNEQVWEVIIRSVADSAGTQAQIQALLKAIYGTA